MAEEDLDFSDEFCRFLQSTIPAVEAAELLFVYVHQPERAWTLPEALRALGPGITEAQAGRYLEAMQGLLLAPGEGGALRYQPATVELDDFARRLERLYRERPVTLIRVIYGLRDSGIRSFADAFRLRRK
jgi:hypothetical protein